MADQSNNSRFLLQALNAANIYRGSCAPNPAVGAVVVKNQQVIASGAHQGVGHPHAEVVALRQCWQRAKGADLYVTLEPCCHYGKTPPCVDLIIQSGVSTVYYGLVDPNARVNGQGISQLQNAGIQCIQLSSNAIDQFYQSYCYWTRTQKPWISAKIALSRNAKIADAQHKPVQLTGDACHRFTHQQRLHSDAILTTVNTVIADNPQLNARVNQRIMAKPVYVLDSDCRLPLQAQLFHTSQQLTIFHAIGAAKKNIAARVEQGARCIAVASSSAHRLLLTEVITHIGQHGVQDLWVEAGGELFEQLYRQKLCQRALIYQSPICLTDQAKSAFSSSFNPYAGQKPLSWTVMGDDLVCEVML